MVESAIFGDPLPNQERNIRPYGTRLRDALSEYYDREGNEDPVIIRFPSGGYTPLAEYRQVTVPSPTAGSRGDWKLPFALLSAVAVLTAIFWLNAQAHSGLKTLPPKPPHPLRFFSNYKPASVIDSGSRYTRLFISPDDQLLFAVGESAIAIVDGVAFQTRRVIDVPGQIRSAAMSTEGSLLLVGLLGGGIITIDPRRSSIVDRFDTEDTVADLTIDHPNSRIFLALQNKGLQVIDLKTRHTRKLSSVTCPSFISLDRAGKYLYVAYQCGGPGGRNGHDSTEVYDAATEKVAFILQGPPIVGNRIRFAPNDEVAMIDTVDACSADYDHQGCPFFPSYGFHLWRTVDRRWLPSKIMTDGDATNGEFFPYSKRVLFGQPNLIIWDWSRHRFVERLDGINSYTAIVNSAENRIYAALTNGGILKIDAEREECSPPSQNLVNHYFADGTAEDAVGLGALAPSNTVTYSGGVRGRAFEFNGTSSFRFVGTSSFCTGCEHIYTVAFFIRTAAPSSSMTILNWAGEYSETNFKMLQTQDGKLALHGVGHLEPIVSRSRLNPGEWRHVAITSDRLTRSLYIDGELQGSTTMNADIQSTAPRIGVEHVGVGGSALGGEFFKGSLDELLVYSRILSATEIRDLQKSCADEFVPPQFKNEGVSANRDGRTQ